MNLIKASSSSARVRKILIKPKSSLDFRFESVFKIEFELRKMLSSQIPLVFGSAQFVTSPNCVHNKLTKNMSGDGDHLKTIDIQKHEKK